MSCWSQTICFEILLKCFIFSSCHAVLNLVYQAALWVKADFLIVIESDMAMARYENNIVLRNQSFVFNLNDLIISSFSP